MKGVGPKGQSDPKICFGPVVRPYCFPHTELLDHLPFFLVICIILTYTINFFLSRQLLNLGLV